MTMTLAVDMTAKPIGLIAMQEAVARIARSMQYGGDMFQVLVADPCRTFRSQHLEVPAPLVIMTPSYVKLPEADTARVNRRTLFARDLYTCQYCGFVASARRAYEQLTVDHVKPARLFANRNEATFWENVCAACKPCNARKGGHLPMEVGMYPARTPRVPHYVQLKFAGRLNEQQRDYVRTYFGFTEDDILI